MKRFFVSFLLLAATLFADAYRAVYDLSSDDFRYLSGRVQLIEKSARMIKTAGGSPDFVITIHSGATPILAALPDEYADESDVPVIALIQSRLQALQKNYGAKVLGCRLAMASLDMKEEELFKGVTPTDNSIIDLIALQNRGYAAIYFIK